ncbi:Component of a membrane-bound complex containing the Tor2p kinase [Malassezia cuniculi]|uniref:Component of a membrane-bound complex containing the Tor2p kinase n=1 Tax=Malassezia cuniculi TaxID=948313 RepID=A0AAF0EWS8_9BASI|nr:Component of a membrane-bound complex containing the Tor2p kinase [Malassezia cuniculi]
MLGWMLRLAEDGIVDEDYPALDRTTIVGDFGADEFALCAIEAKPRLPALDKPKEVLVDQANSPPSSASEIQVIVPSTKQHVNIAVTPEMTASEAVTIACQTMLLGDPEQFVFTYPSGQSVPSDAMATSLVGPNGVLLVDVSNAPEAATPIEQPKYRTAMDVISRYNSYHVVRRNPLSLRRHDLVITMDGSWIHIMCVNADSRPAEKRMFQRKSATIHASWVLECEVAPRAPSSFRIVFTRRGGDTKRYDLEAEDRITASK